MSLKSDQLELGLSICVIVELNQIKYHSEIATYALLSGGLVVCLKGLDKTVQTQIRLLLRKQSYRGLPCLLFW